MGASAKLTINFLTELDKEGYNPFKTEDRKSESEMR